MEHQHGILVKVGIFCVIGILLLIWFSLQPMAKKKVENPYTLIAYFDEAKSLEEGEIVALMGKEIGKVKSIEFDPERRKVKIELNIAGKYHIPQDSVAGIYYKSLLGWYYVDIEYGESGDMLSPGSEIPTKEISDLNTIMSALGDMSTDAENLISSLNENQAKVADRITTLLDENQENIKKTTTSFADIGPKLQEVADEVQSLIKELREGDSTLAKLLSDEELYKKLDTIINNINSLTTDLRNGQGTLGKLLYDDALHNDLKTTLNNINDAAGEAKTFLGDNREKIDTVMTSLEKTAPKLEETADNLSELSKSIKEGKGSLGKLVNDPSLYDSALRTLNQLEQTFREGEEQGIMRTVVGVLFSALL